ncbi:MAG: hypothetical protein ACFFDN_41395 [Candidatus Hodarchaeota archaeon]
MKKPFGYMQFRFRRPITSDMLFTLLQNSILQIIIASLILYYLVTNVATRFGFIFLIFMVIGFFFVIYFTARIKEALLFIFFIRFTVDMFWNVRFLGLSALDFAGGLVFVIFFFNLFIKKVKFLNYNNSKIVMLFLIVSFTTHILGVTQLYLAGVSVNRLGTLKLIVRSFSPFLFYFITPIYFRYKTDMKKFVYAWVLGCIIPSITMIYAIIMGYGFERTTHGVARFAGFYHEAAGPGIVSSVLIFLIFLIFATEKLRRTKFITLFSLLALNFYTLYISFARVFVIPIVGGIIFWFIVQKKYFVSFILTILTVIAFLKLPMAKARFEVERQYLEGEAYFISVGTGRPEKYGKAFDMYIHEYNITQKIFGKGPALPFSPHNEYFDMLLTGGLIRFIVYIRLFMLITKALINGYISEKDKFLKKFNLVTLILFASMPFQALSGSPLSWINLQWFIWSAVGISLNYKTSISSETNNGNLI